MAAQQHAASAEPTQPQPPAEMVDLATSLSDRELVRRMSIKWRDAGRLKVREKRTGPTAPNSAVCSPTPGQRLPRQQQALAQHQEHQSTSYRRRSLMRQLSDIADGGNGSSGGGTGESGVVFELGRRGPPARHRRQMSVPSTAQAAAAAAAMAASAAATADDAEASGRLTSVGDDSVEGIKDSAAPGPESQTQTEVAEPSTTSATKDDNANDNKDIFENDDSSSVVSSSRSQAPVTTGADGSQGSPSARHLHTPSCLNRPGSFSSTIDPVDIDRLSQYSLYMVHDARFYFQHPYLRMICTLLVVFLNFLIYAEDPIADSSQVCSIPVLGNVFAFVFSRYPPNAWSLLKVIMWLLGILVGIIAGKLCHVFVFNRWFRLKMFANDEGSWMTMWFSTIISVYIFSNIYNAFLLTLGGTSNIPYLISMQMGIKNSTFMKMAATGTWLGDFMTAWMVSDMMLQERLYPSWNRFIRQWWRSGYTRIVMFWLLLISLCTTVITVICTDIIRWDYLNRGFAPSNELSRAFLAASILSLDLLIVMQDWDFPNFTNSLDVRLPGVAKAIYAFDIRIPDWFKRIVDDDVWTVHITGKWFNYGVLFVVMCLDLNMWKNQMIYSPCEYGQYVGPYGSIYTVHNETELALVDCSSDNHTLNYEYRNQTFAPDGETLLSKDIWTHSRYTGYPLYVKLSSFLLSLTAFAVFGALVVIFGRYSEEHRDVYQGRMKKNRTLNNLLVRHSVHSLDNIVEVEGEANAAAAADAVAAFKPSTPLKSTVSDPGVQRLKRLKKMKLSDRQHQRQEHRQKLMKRAAQYCSCCVCSSRCCCCESRPTDGAASGQGPAAGGQTMDV
ncbi:hypothetical protein BOX15_Mlig013874g1 [Macrostomum lignano]|uniref:Transmembrane protein 117 n=1 Tax=Macrostomum lignano TaxID=282301 RepID=A0A267ES21_9PLAT|nr:hypothetical protein BOX15_Mlig013874g1 [Macrostomum lignano]